LSTPGVYDEAEPSKWGFDGSDDDLE